MIDVVHLKQQPPKVLEFFAGIGLARLGLEQAGFQVAWANDYSNAKKELYDANFSEHSAHYVLGDIGAIRGKDLPTDAALAWASSPCTDLSLAGGRAGLAGRHSGTFWQFIRVLEEMGKNQPESVVLENVTGLATSHGGDDISAAIRAFNSLGYSVDVLAIDARRFLPQSRPRLFLVGAMNPPTDDPTAIPELRPDWLQWIFSDPSLRTHRAALPPLPAMRMDGLDEVVEHLPSTDVRWWDADRTSSFLMSLSSIQRDRVALLRHGSPTFRTAYRRTRNGVAVWEVRPDSVAGCLRTANGGSSKQALVEAGNGSVRVRWMTPREYARLMGAPDFDLTSSRVNQALIGFGDAVAVPAVHWLGRNYLIPLLDRSVESVNADLALAI